MLEKFIKQLGRLYKKAVRDGEWLIALKIKELELKALLNKKEYKNDQEILNISQKELDREIKILLKDLFKTKGSS